MGRTSIIAFVLAVLWVGAACGLPASSSKSHKRAVPAPASQQSTSDSHKKTRRPANHVAGHTTERATGRTAGHERGRTVQRASARRHTADKGVHSASPGQPSRSRRVAKAHSGTKSHRALKSSSAANPHKDAKFHPAAKLHRQRKLDPAAEPRKSVETNAVDQPEVTSEDRPVAVEVDPSAVAEDASMQWARRGMPPPLRGSLASLVRQNERTEADGLERIEDDADLADRIARGMLVPVPTSAALTVNGNLPRMRRYCRPWTAAFLRDLARAHAAAFHSQLEVSSAVRTVAYQKKLERVNGNAAQAEGDIASPHLTGAAIDIAKSGLSRQEIGWMRAWLLPLEKAGKIDVEEEFQQACFHITVYKCYVPPRAARRKAVRAASLPGTAERSGL